MLGQLEDGQRVVIADMEAGAGTLTRLPPASLDVALLVVEPSAKSIDVARRARSIIDERKIGPIIIVANRVRDAADLELVRASFADLHSVAIPDDPAVTQADREGAAAIDVAATAPAVKAIARLAELIERGDLSSSAAR